MKKGEIVDLGLKGLRAVVTGGTRGIGRSILELLVDEGCSVATCARNEAGVASTLESLRSRGGHAVGRAVDVRNPADVATWFNESVETLGGVDILISNASARLDGQGEAWWRETFDNDLLQHIRTVELAMPHLMGGNHSAVVLMGSIASVLTTVPSTELAYGPMKAALITYGAQLAARTARDGVRVNCVSPGPVFIEGGVWDQTKQQDPALYQRVERLAALGRLGRPEEIAKAAVFIASPAASYLTGANIRIDGGTVKAVNF